MFFYAQSKKEGKNDSDDGDTVIILVINSIVIYVHWHAIKGLFKKK